MILLDSDGLAANFKAGLAKYIPWSDFSAMNETQQHNFLVDVFTKDSNFFNTLPKVEQFIDIIEHCERSGERWMICTAAGEAHPSFLKAKESKILWFEREWGIGANKIIVTPTSAAKINYANPHNILVDDWRVNCERFTEAGGFAIHVRANEYNSSEVCKRIDDAIQQMHLLEVTA